MKGGGPRWNNETKEWYASEESGEIPRKYSELEAKLLNKLNIIPEKGEQKDGIIKELSGYLGPRPKRPAKPEDYESNIGFNKSLAEAILLSDTETLEYCSDIITESLALRTEDQKDKLAKAEKKGKGFKPAMFKSHKVFFLKMLDLAMYIRDVLDVSRDSDNIDKRKAIQILIKLVEEEKEFDELAFDFSQLSLGGGKIKKKLSKKGKKTSTRKKMSRKGKRF